MKIENIIGQSIQWRLTTKMDQQSIAIRLFAGISDGIEGLLIEQFGPFILASIYNPQLNSSKERILAFLSEFFAEKSILIKIREETDSNNYSYLNNQHYQKDSILYCSENGSKYEIHTDPRHDYGLYLDTKAAREFIEERSSGKTILNLFSYTCAFAIAAMKAGANAVTNIDPSKEYLNWGQRNAELNDVSFKKYPDTTQAYLARHIRRLDSGKDTSYDSIIVDPPAFLVGRGSQRLTRNMWPIWMECLKQSNCPEFIFVINDRSLGKRKDLNDFFIEGLGSDIVISPIKQSLDVVGQALSNKDDSYYFNPAIFHIKRT